MKPAGRFLSVGWAPVLAALVLAGSVLVQALPLVRPSLPSRPPHLAAKVPAQPAGWTVRDVPLGPSEFMAGEVEKVLNYDDVINRDYRRGAEQFGLYVAYWGPGKMPTQLVASHTPDRCWTENGWHCLEMRFRQQDVLAGAGLQPVEWRLFEPPGGAPPVYVLYWHLVDGEVYDYGERFNAVPDPVRWWRGAIQQALHGPREQYFIRLTSSQPLEELWTDPGFRVVVQSLSALGLARPVPALRAN